MKYPPGNRPRPQLSKCLSQLVRRILKSGGGTLSVCGTAEIASGVSTHAAGWVVKNTTRTTVVRVLVRRTDRVR